MIIESQYKQIPNSYKTTINNKGRLFTNFVAITLFRVPTYERILNIFPKSSRIKICSEIYYWI